MKLTLFLLLALPCLAQAETEERLEKRFPAQPEGKLVVEVSFGAIEVSTNANSEVSIDVLRKITRNTKEDEEAFLAERPVTFSQEGNVITVRERSRVKDQNSRGGRQRTSGKYSIQVPARFELQLMTSGGAIEVSDVGGEVEAKTSGGALKFERLRGALLGQTSGGPIRMADCQGALKVNTSGGAIDVSGGSGTLNGATSGGPVAVKRFAGHVSVKTSGGGIDIQNVTGKVEGLTSGGPISARFASAPSEAVKLDTSGGGVTVHVPENSAFDLDAATSGGSVSSDLKVETAGKPSRTHLKGPVNGGGKPVVLRSNGGNVKVLTN